MIRQPKHPWAAPSAAYCRYRLTGDRRCLAQLRRMARRAGDSCGLADLLAGLAGDYTPSARQARARQLLEGQVAPAGPTPAER